MARQRQRQSAHLKPKMYPGGVVQYSGALPEEGVGAAAPDLSGPLPSPPPPPPPPPELRGGEGDGSDGGKGERGLGGVGGERTREASKTRLFSTTPSRSLR